MTAQGAELEQAEAVAPPRRRWTTKLTFAAAVAVVLVASGGTAYAVDRHNNVVLEQRIAAATGEHDDAVSSLLSDTSACVDALDKAKATSASVAADAITNPAALEALRALVDEAAALLGDAASFDLTIPDGAQVAKIEAMTASVDALNGRLVAATQKLASAVMAVTESHDAFMLDEAGNAFDAAVMELKAQATASRSVLDGSEGKVADDAVRQGLRASIDDANRVAGAIKATTADAVDAQTTSVTDAEADLVAKTQTVTDAQTAWQMAQDAAAQAQTGSKRSMSAGTTSGSTGAKSSAGTKPGSTGTSAGTKSGSTEGGTSTALGGQITDTTPPASTPAQAIAGLQAARAAAGLQNVTSCSEIPGSVQGSVGVVHAVTWQELLTSSDHRAMVMVPKPAIMKAWNTMGADGIHQVVYVQIWACIVPS